MQTSALRAPAPMADPDKDPEQEAPLLFCPFCRECYEGETHCPVHELALVDFIDLPKQAHERVTVGWEDAVDPWEARFGRGWLAAGVVASVVGFFLPLATATAEGQTSSWAALDLANGAAPNLWSIPFAAALFVVFLYRRQTPLQMRGARLAAILLAVTPAFSLAYSMRNVSRGVAQQHGAVALEWGSGVYVLAIGCLLLLVGAVRFGVMPKSPSDAPHGAAPDDDAQRGIDTRAD